MAAKNPGVTKRMLALRGRAGRERTNPPGLFGSGTVVSTSQMPPRIVIGRKLM